MSVAPKRVSSRLNRTLIVLAREFSRDMMIEGQDTSRLREQAKVPDKIDDRKFHGMHRHFTDAGSVLLFGGGIKRGASTAPERPCKSIEDPVSTSDLHATLYRAVGIPRPRLRNRATPLLRHQRRPRQTNREPVRQDPGLLTPLTPRKWGMRQPSTNSLKFKLLIQSASLRMVEELHIFKNFLLSLDSHFMRIKGLISTLLCCECTGELFGRRQRKPGRRKATQQMASIAEIIHLSDLHFGPNNITNIVGPTTTRRSLAELILRDLKKPPPPLPLIEAGEVELTTPTYQRVICVTGDFAVAGSSEELEEAQRFLKELYTGLGWDLEMARSRIVLIPGNHDLEWNKSDNALRWQTWRVFFDDFYGIKSERDDPLAWVRLVEIRAANVAVLCLDSEHHIHSTSKYRNCGAVDDQQIEKIESLLVEAAKDPWFVDAIKVCVVHHHPILIPSLVELGRGAGQTNDEPGYDAVFNAQRILNLLHHNGFQLLLHGHKHIPHVFTEDIVNACHRTEDHSMIVVAGGTLGSNDSQPIDGWRQCYNQIFVHWSAQRQSTRTEITTRGLVRSDTTTGVELSWSKWRWMTMRVVDRFSSPWLTVPSPNLERQQPEPPYPRGSARDKSRTDEYIRLRGNMPVVEARPSLIPGQDFEVKFWITPHTSARFRQADSDRPTKVIWSAGALFPMITIDRNDDEMFCGVYHCYGPMLLQAEIFFEDVASPQITYIYARIPEEKKD